MVKREYTWVYLAIFFAILCVILLLLDVQSWELLNQLQALGADTTQERNQFWFTVGRNIVTMITALFSTLALYERERKRQHAARGKGTLVRNQPTPQSLEMVPQSFRFRPSWVFLALMAGMFVLFAVLCIAIAVAVPGTLGIALGAAACFLLVGILVAALVYFLIAATLIIDDRALVLRRRGREVTLPWSEVRLFGMHTNDRNTYSSTEVAGPVAIIRWHSTASYFIRTTLTERDEQAVLAHIASKTDLPIYHL